MPDRPASRITIKDLARELGMSVATVARAFHEGAAIAAETRALVLKRAAALGYQPNALARGMITRRTRIVGVVASDLHNPFYPDVLARLSEALQQAGCNMMLVTGGGGTGGGEAAALRLLLSYRPECVLILATTLSSAGAEACAAAGTPLLYLNRFPGAAAAAIVCDNAEGAAALTRHLLDQGARRPAFIGGLADSSTQSERRAGFLAVCAERGILPREHPAGAFSYEAGHAAALALLQGGQPPDALLCASDILAIGALEAARHVLGLRVPGDLLVAGFDDIPPAAWPSHDLTTWRQPLDAMLAAALDWLAPVLAGIAPPPPGLTRLPGRLVARGSTATTTRTEEEQACQLH